MTKKGQRRDTVGNKEQHRGEYIEARVTRARPHDRFPILLEPAPPGSAHGADNFREQKGIFPGSRFII